ncbi:CDGSH iron-sulfur domain-containing protein [Bacillus marinisedimentorum]|uniref:CDGSH iron-sulfur domain-containing protein n=1 Tax=Bacillus marinisedimentorum TaxID=1821260 RepID=UPI00087226FD|nr:CDGSH iron-sulfur domain-containing protein [Bacillus marinisedimentorum]
MSDVKLKVMDNGPLLVNGDFEVVDVEGNAFETKNSVSLCRCGLSGNKPFCDGAHRGQFDSKVRAEQE